MGLGRDWVGLLLLRLRSCRCRCRRARRWWSPVMSSAALQVQELDARSLKKLLNALDKKATENLQLRAKYQGDPMKCVARWAATAPGWWRSRRATQACHQAVTAAVQSATAHRVYKGSGAVPLAPQVPGQRGGPAVHCAQHCAGEQACSGCLDGRCGQAQPCTGTRGRHRIPPTAQHLMHVHSRTALQTAGSPELYPVLCEGTAVATLAGLLAHENMDIVMEVVDVLQELTDAGVGRQARKQACCCLPQEALMSDMLAAARPLPSPCLPAGRTMPLPRTPPHRTPLAQMWWRTTRRRRPSWCWRCWRPMAWSCWWMPSHAWTRACRWGRRTLLTPLVACGRNAALDVLTCGSTR